MSLLEVNDLSIQFGGLHALEHVTFAVDSGEIVGLIGPNGAGKTTVFNLITSIYPPLSGEIKLDGVSLIGRKTHQIFQSGVSRTFQNIRLFKHMSVLDNARVAYHHRMKYGVLAGAMRMPRYWREEREATDRALELLDLFNMKPLAEELASNLPYGRQRELEIVRALIGKPKLLLLDEPAAGMNPTETHSLMDTICRIRNLFGVGVLLIEHDMSLVMGICERIVVLDYGQVIAAGAPREIRSDQRVIGAYLGVARAAGKAT
ncbi:MAG: ABC transporter ATP-binding protein [Oscillospiraceae bacterium]|jgi:branched-chain amino acid transport system ATP-binding protein|nr:ABC transporter ATP-binding protein [Oscillospiraceae bacterium]